MGTEADFSLPAGFAASTDDPMVQERVYIRRFSHSAGTLTSRIQEHVAGVGKVMSILATALQRNGRCEWAGLVHFLALRTDELLTDGLDHLRLPKDRGNAVTS